MAPTEWLRLFPEADFRFRIGVRQGDAPRFFAREPGWQEREQLRESALDSAAERYAGALPESAEAIREAGAAMLGGAADLRAAEPGGLCAELGRKVDADWVILSGDPSEHHPVIAGCVCFPSSWSLPEKLGKPIEKVHAPVPTVAETLDASIHTFLSRLAPGAAWERENWGFAADSQLDHHPAIPAPPLTPPPGPMPLGSGSSGNCSRGCRSPPPSSSG
ncbi:MAG: DUF3445 domain-containing protein [Verrucomicrobiales bacterium]